MNKIGLIFQREYLSRVRKKSFIVMSLIGPLLTVALFAVPVLIARMSDKGKTVAVADAGNLFASQLPEDKEDIRFVRITPDLNQAKTEFKKGKYDALLYIPELDLNSPGGFRVFSRKGLGVSLERDINRARRRLSEQLGLQGASVKVELVMAAHG